MDEILKNAMLALQKGARPEDVDAWVAQKTGGQFTSLQQLQQSAGGDSMAKGLGRQFLEGAAMGWSGELAGPKWQQQLDEFRDRHGALATAANVAGGVVSSLIPGALLAKGVAPAAGLGMKILQGLGLGVGEGALSGAGFAEEGEKVRGAVTGGVVGGAFGGVLPVVGATAGAIGRRIEMLTQPERAALKLKVKQLDAAVLAGKASVDELLAKFKELDALAPGLVTTADLSPQLRQMLDAAVTQSPVAAEAAAGVIAPRTVKQASRMAGSLEDIVGYMPDAPTAVEAAKAELKLVGAQLFDGMELPASTSQKVADFFKRPIVKDAAKAAEASEDLAGIMSVGPTLTNAQMVRDFLGEASKKAVGSRRAHFGRALEELNMILDDVPGYRDAAKQYRAKAVVIDALEQGGEVMAKVEDPRLVKRMIDELRDAGGEPAVEAFQYGMVDQLWRSLKGIATNRDAAKRMMTRSDELDALLQTAIPDKAKLDRFLKMVAGESELEKLTGSGAGSQTARRAADAARMGGGMDEAGATIGAGAIMGGPVQGAMTGALAAGAHAFRDIPNRLQGRVAEAMAPDLLATGTGVEDVLRMVASRNSKLQQSLYRMGLLRSMTSGGAGAAAGGLLAPR